MLTAFVITSVLQSAWALGAMAQESPPELQQFEFLVGCFDVDVSMWQASGESWGAPVKGRFRGRWALDGWAIRDEWIGLQNSGQPDHLGRGADLRTYDPNGRRWVIAWSHVAVPGTRDRRARRKGDSVRVWQPYPEVNPAWEAQFDLGESRSWTRTDYRSTDGETWYPERKMWARPVSCADAGW